MQFHARFFDGEIAMDHAVDARLEGPGIVFSGHDVPEKRWTYSKLIAIESPQRGMAFRITHEKDQGTRLVIADEAAVTELLKRAPFLKGGINMRRVARVVGIAAGSIAATVLAGWLLLTVAPQQLAYLLPREWVKETGSNMERAFVEGRKLCTDGKGDAVLKTFAARLKEGNPDFPEIELKVYDLGMINAFALPGGHVILSRQLIEAAKRPEEVAGVLAHEIGHVSHKHPEAQMVRVMGVSVLLSLASGGGDSFGSAAAFLAILRYSREAEREADAYAREMMKAAAVDPLGFKAFFETIKRDSGEEDGGALGPLTSILSTHPLTNDRIAAIEPLPAGIAARPVLSDADWKTLRDLCGPLT